MSIISTRRASYQRKVKGYTSPMAAKAVLPKPVADKALRKDIDEIISTLELMKRTAYMANYNRLKSKAQKDISFLDIFVFDE